LKPSTYYYKDSRSTAKHRSIGLIAQDVEGIFPELVYQEDGGYRMLNYSAVAVIAIKVIQEQQQQINVLAAQTDSLKTELTELRQMIMNLGGNGGTMGTMSGYLEQNRPNPGNGTTTITYHVGEAVGFAKLMITDASGQVIKTIQLNNRGTGQVNVDTRPLAAGVYNYTLYVDSKRTDSKKFVIAR
jgi:hypothetical protein